MHPIQEATCYFSISDPTIFEMTDADAIMRNEEGKAWGIRIVLKSTDSAEDVYEKIADVAGLRANAIKLDLSRAPGLATLTMQEALQLEEAGNLGERIIHEIGSHAIALIENR